MRNTIINMPYSNTSFFIRNPPVPECVFFHCIWLVLKAINFALQLRRPLSIAAIFNIKVKGDGKQEHQSLDRLLPINADADQ